MLTLIFYIPISLGHSLEDTTSTRLLQATPNIHHRRASVRQSNAHRLIGVDFQLPLSVHSDGTGGPLQYNLIIQRDHPVLLGMHCTDKARAHRGLHPGVALA